MNCTRQKKNDFSSYLLRSWLTDWHQKKEDFFFRNLKLIALFNKLFAGMNLNTFECKFHVNLSLSSLIQCWLVVFQLYNIYILRIALQNKTEKKRNIYEKATRQNTVGWGRIIQNETNQQRENWKHKFCFHF